MPSNHSKELNTLLTSLVDRFGQGLDHSDCTTEAWIAYMEAKQTFHSYAGCCTWDTYLAFRVQEALDVLRRQRSQLIQLQSPFSLNQQLGENGPPALDLFPSCQSGFENAVLFWDYVHQLDSPLREIARHLAQGDSREEIMKEMNMDRSQFDFWQDALREELRLSYLDIA